MEETKLKLDIADFIKSYVGLVEETKRLSNNDSPTCQSAESLENKKHARMSLPTNTRVPPTTVNEPKVQTSKNYSKVSSDGAKPIKKPQKTKEIHFKNQSHYVGEHSKRRSLFIRKDSNQNSSIPSSMQSNFPVITFHTFTLE